MEAAPRACFLPPKINDIARVAFVHVGRISAMLSDCGALLNSEFG